MLLNSKSSAWALLLALAVPAGVLAADDPVPRDRAVLLVRLPARATLTIGSSATQQTGAERLFLTPTLEPGKAYTYRLTATWQEGGEAKTVVRDVTVQAGQRTEVDFPTASTRVENDKPRARAFLFTYSATVTGL